MILIVLNSQGGKFYFNTSNPAIRAQYDKVPLVILGTYESHPKLTLIPNTPQEIASMSGGEASVSWIEKPTILYQSPASMYYHWLMDDTLGLFWMIRHHRLKPEEVMVLLQGHSSSMRQNWRGVLTETDPRTVESFAGSGLTCFRDLYAGPASRHFGGQVQCSLFLNF